MSPDIPIACSLTGPERERGATLLATVRAHVRGIEPRPDGPGELFVVPRGVEHPTYAEQQTSLLLIEPTGPPNTGDAKTAAPRQEL